MGIGSKAAIATGVVRPAMSFNDDLHRIEEHVAEARRLVDRQRGLVIRLRARGVDTWDAQKILSLLEANLRRFEEHRDRLRANVRR
jgi:hypothetical protein